jgi:hypothetical protein
MGPQGGYITRFVDYGGYNNIIRSMWTLRAGHKNIKDGCLGFRHIRKIFKIISFTNKYQF